MDHMLFANYQNYAIEDGQTLFHEIVLLMGLIVTRMKGSVLCNLLCWGMGTAKCPASFEIKVHVFGIATIQITIGFISHGKNGI